MSSNSSSRTTWFYRPNHNDQSKPYLNGLCCRPDLRVRTPSLRVHITCQRAWIDSGGQIRPEPPILATYWPKVKVKHRKANNFARVAGPKTRPDYYAVSTPIIYRRGVEKSTAETYAYPAEALLCFTSLTQNRITAISVPEHPGFGSDLSGPKWSPLPARQATGSTFPYPDSLPELPGPSGSVPTPGSLDQRRATVITSTPGRNNDERRRLKSG
jgi:hypothetical protein